MSVEPAMVRAPQPNVSATFFGVHKTVALMDQGCLPANLMSVKFWDTIKNSVPEGTEVTPYERGYGSASADRGSGIRTSYMVDLPVKLTYEDLVHESVCTFVVCTCGRDVMMGWSFIHQVGYEFNAPYQVDAD